MGGRLGKRLTCSSYSKHFVWGLGPGGSAFQGRGWDQWGAGLFEGLADGSLLHRQEGASPFTQKPRFWNRSFCSSDPRPSPVDVGLGTLCRTLVPVSCSRLAPGPPHCTVALQGPPTGDTRVPDGDAEGAGAHSSSCVMLATDTWMCPLCSTGHVGSFVPGLVGYRGVEMQPWDTCPSPMDTHTVLGLCSLPWTLLPWEPRGGARSPSPLPRAQRGESQVRHVANLICSSH